MGRSDEDPVNRNAGGFRGQGLCLVADGPWDHATVDDGDRDTHLTSLEDEATRLEISGVHLPSPPLGEPSTDQIRVKGTSHVLDVSPCPKCLFNGLDGRSPKA
ncbi:MAG: hypothetical protein O3B25_10355 [Verrucomicrobia bacterium]|nr:hypothetical protein [Verrucomicrobiota bacterium]